VAQEQSISHTGSFGWILPSEDVYWSEETRTTLESKIRSLKINKKRFKTTDPSKNR